MWQSQLPHSARPIRQPDSTDPTHTNPVHIHLPEEINSTAAAAVLIRRWGFLALEKGPTFAGEDPAKPLHRADPVSGDPRVQRSGTAIPVAHAAAEGGGGGVRVLVGVEKDDLEGAWRESDEETKVGQWCC